MAQKDASTTAGTRPRRGLVDMFRDTVRLLTGRRMNPQAPARTQAATPRTPTLAPRPAPGASSATTVPRFANVPRAEPADGDTASGDQFNTRLRSDPMGRPGQGAMMMTVQRAPSADRRRMREEAQLERSDEDAITNVRMRARAEHQQDRDAPGEGSGRPAGPRDDPPPRRR